MGPRRRNCNRSALLAAALLLGRELARNFAGPLRGAEGMLLADCDLVVGLHAKRWFDAVGHYGREDVLGTGRRPERPQADPPSDLSGGPG